MRAPIVSQRPRSPVEVTPASVFLHCGDDELKLLSAALAVMIAQVEDLGDEGDIDGSIWEASEQPEDFPPLRELSKATSMYG